MTVVGELVLSELVGELDSGDLHMDGVPHWHLLASEGNCVELVRSEQVWLTHPQIYTYWDTSVNK